MPKGGRRSTTWNSPWVNAPTKLVRVPIAIAEEILTLAKRIDRGEKLTETDEKATGESENVETLQEKADRFLMSIPPKDRRTAKRLLYRFIENLKE
jgi:hypothetical protein